MLKMYVGYGYVSMVFIYMSFLVPLCIEEVLEWEENGVAADDMVYIHI